MRGWVLWLLVGLGSCSDPVHEQRVAALGAEVPGVPPGPLHRPGQPCGVCHGVRGPADRAFYQSGTVYLEASSDTPLAGVRVRLLDARGASGIAETNCAGNFFITASEGALEYPLWVRLEWGDQVVEMRSPISRETSCAGCHERPAGPRSPGQIHFFGSEASPPQVPPCE